MIEREDIFPDLDIDTDYPCKNYKIKVGCGNLYISVIYNEDKPHNVLIHRKSKCACDMTFFDALQKQSTFQTRRDISQLIKDLKGSLQEKNYCQKFNASLKEAIKEGNLAAFSCSDAVARVLRNELKKEKEDSQEGKETA